LHAFSRSQTLSEGLRLPIFLTLMVFIIIYMFLNFAMQGFSTDWEKFSLAASILVGLLTSGLLPVLWNSFLVSLYQELLRVKQGDDALGLGSVDIHFSQSMAETRATNAI
jgi:hypothetical protein